MAEATADGFETPLERRRRQAAERRAQTEATREARRQRQAQARAERQLEGGLPWGFILVFFAGVAILLWDPGDSAASTLLKAQWLLPIILTIVYCVVGGLTGLHRQGRRGLLFIDNCYFLGFLFTQVALVISFLRLWWKQQAASEAAADAVLRAAEASQATGATQAATGTTVQQATDTATTVGQAAVDAAQQTAEAATTGISADQLVPLIAASLGASVVGLFFKLIYEQQVKDDHGASVAAREKLDKAAEEMTKQFASVQTKFKQLSDDLKISLDAARGTIENIQGIDSHVRAKSTQVAEAANNLAVAVGQLHTKFDQAVAFADLSEVNKDFRNAVNALSSIRDLAKNSEAVLQSASEGLARVNRAGEKAMEGVSTRVSSTLSQEIASAASALKADLAKQVVEIKAIVQDFDRELAAIERMRKT